MSRSEALTTKIVDAALTLAERRSWESVRLHEVAAAADVSLAEMREHVRDKEDLVEAWLDRADAAMLQRAAEPDFTQWPPRERLKRIVLSWLEALEPKRRVTRQMVLSRCAPGRLDVQIPAILRLGRTVQWMREAAGLRESGIRRLLAEAALASILVATFVYWLRDDSADSAGTRDLLDTLLEKAEGAAGMVPGLRFGGDGWAEVAPSGPRPAPVKDAPQ